MRRHFLALAAAVLASTASAENLGPNLQLNGFASAALTSISNDFDGAYRPGPGPSHGITENIDGQPESVVGLQLDYRINEETNLVTQLVAEGQWDYDLRAEWAYIRYALTDDLALRGGRIAFPPFLYSDSRLVGYAYPWARLPSEIYDHLDITSLDGLDLLYRQPLGDWTLSGQLVLGTTESSGLKVNNARGANLSLGNDALTARISYIEGDVTGDATPAGLPKGLLALDKAKGRFADIGLVYDDGEWFAAAEWGQLGLEGWGEDWDAGYVSVGHYFGKWLPYALWSKSNTSSDRQDMIFLGGLADLSGTLIQEQSTMALGVRVDAKPGLAIKAQVDRIGDFNGTRGLFQNHPDESSVFLYTLALNVAF